VTAPDLPPLHPDIAHLEFLLGDWAGSGSGEYPTIDSFEFSEHTTFGHVGKPFVTFVQRTKGADGKPLHTESGYLRPVGTERVEFVLTMPSGIVESLEGTVRTSGPDGGRIELSSVQVLTTATAKSVVATERTYEVSGGLSARPALAWTFAMSAVGQPMTHHLSGVLRRNRP
jgi:hypothetical protein